MKKQTQAVKKKLLENDDVNNILTTEIDSDESCDSKSTSPDKNDFDESKVIARNKISVIIEDRDEEIVSI